MTLGKRITMGFAILVAITLILGVIGVINMRSAATGADKLASIYAPEVQVASEIFKEANQIRYDIRGFVMQDNDAALANAKKGLVQIQKELAVAQELGKKYNLKALLEQESKATKGVNEYITTVERAEKILARKRATTTLMTDSANIFMKNAEEFLSNQNTLMKQEIQAKIDPNKLLERLEKINKINDVIDLGNAARIAGQRAQVRRDITIIEAGVKNFDTIYKLISEIRLTVTRPANLEQLKAVETAARNYEGALKSFVAILQETATESAILVKLAGEVLNAAEMVVDLGIKNTTDIAQESNESLSLASWIMVVGLIIAFILSVITAFLIIRSIVKIVTEAVKSLSEGTTQVVSASEQISSASVSLAEGASSQASSVEEVSATIEEATASNNQNADNSREANILAQHSNDAAKVGNQRVGDLMVAMQEITASSQKISRIIKTIDEIAFQTNLLALNAAVEAARAGEHGLGFAVVAEEVKNLAERSAGAAKEITGIIEASIDQVKAGTEVANKTKESFTEILNGIKKTSDLIGEIAISAKEQAEGMNQIATAMGSVDQITQQNASASEETAAAAEELNAQALSMLDNVSELALLAGFDMGKENRAPKSIKRISTPSMPPKRLSMNSNTKKPMNKSSMTTSRRNNEDVFPLDESDLKEF